MNFDEFFDRLEKWEEKTEEDSRRKAITALLRSRPNAYKEAIVKSALDRIMWYFENDKFGVVSACKANNSKKKNFELQLRLINKLKTQKLHCIAHIGFWEKIGTRSLFIPQITEKRSRILAKELKLNAYIWGEERDWKCYRTCNGSIILKDNKPRVIDIDLDFLVYSRITAKENQLSAIIQKDRRNCQNSSSNSKRDLLRFRRELQDLKKIENDLINESDEPQ